MIREGPGTPPYVTPYLDALGRMQERTMVRPEKLLQRAQTLLSQCFGTSRRRIEAAFAHGAAGLLADHTHYFDGFAILMSLPLGAAVALRESESQSSRVVFEGSSEIWDFDLTASGGSDAPEWVRVVEEVLMQVSPGASQVDAAVVGTVPSCCVDSYHAALGLASANAAQALFASPAGAYGLQQCVREVISRCVRRPFSIAYPMASSRTRGYEFLLVDTHTSESLPVGAPSRDELGWGMIDVGMGPLREASFDTERAEMADEAAGILRRKGFSSIASLRDLEHKDLNKALDALPRRLRPIVRHLVTDNRRVQKLVAAIRRRDWQMFGALLLMSHSSLQKDWGSTNELVDLVVHETEAMTLEGMYGATLVGRGGCVVVAGRPFTVPRCLDHAQEALKQQFDVDADVMLL